MCDVVLQLQRPNVVFDFGNVLIQWNPERLLREFAQDKEELGYLMTEVCSPEWNARMDRGEPIEKCCLEQAELFPEYKDAIMAYGKRWFDMVPGEVPGMLELVKSLKGDGVHRVFGLSNFSKETFVEARKRFPVLQEIDEYVISGSIGWIKPETEIYLFFLRSFGLHADECVFIDDSIANIEKAKRIGFDTILFNTNFLNCI